MKGSVVAGQASDVGPLDALADGSMREADLDGTKVLLVRDGDAVHALAATCPHAGAPLAQGVLHGGRLICPWHKATFCVRTGAVLEPPAVDPLERFEVEIRDGRVLVSRADPVQAAEPVADARCFVIIGAGGAGAVAAQTLREQGFGGRVVMLDRENRVPYDRTILSKYALSGEKGAEKTPLQSQAYYREHRIERRTGEVARLDATARRITCADGSQLTYDAALIATGGTPSVAGVPGETLDGVFLLRVRADAEAILARAERSERAVVLGASFIGMEVAASLRERGLEVTVVGREAVPFEKQVGEDIGRAMQALHEERGVRFRLQRGVRALRGEGTVRAGVLDDDEEIPADLVVVGFGVRPATGFVAGVPVNDDGSVSVDSHLRVADGLFAAGDIARFPDRGGAPIRVEHWRVAQQHGRVAALNMLGGAVRHEATPVFWTIHYMKRLDYVGHAPQWDAIVRHGDLGKREFLAYFVAGGVVRAAAGMDRDRDMAALVELFDMRRDWTAGDLGEQPAALLAGLGR